MLTNWGGNHTYRASAVARPSTLSELQQLIAESAELSVVGTRHSFNAIGDGAALVDLSVLASPPIVDIERGVVSVGGSTTYAELSETLARHGRALHNLASLPHISVAGAIATGTHGSGSRLGNLATAVESIEMITAAGEVVHFHRGDDDFDGAVVHLGALGLVIRVGLRVEETYDVEQTVYDELSWSTLTASFDEVFESATSVSVFTRWGSSAGELWCKQRADARPRTAITDELRPAETQRHPIPDMETSACTPQRSEPGPWWNRLPHFRADAEPSAGAEIQSEFFVDRTVSSAAIEAIRTIGPLLDDVLLVSEIRTIAADDLWMSPCHGRDSTAFHFTWRRDPGAVEQAVDQVAAVLEPFGARPHWGKVFPSSWRPGERYERWGDFLNLRDRLDPQRRMTTPWFERHLG
ncbi:FAD-binding protein [Ilumatobacter sp.]|uniref:FAD-binding protein n=1 Tax=Ilumatobacter sp. TaxID=1967498 RepID=UPI003C69FE56